MTPRRTAGATYASIDVQVRRDFSCAAINDAGCLVASDWCNSVDDGIG